MIFNLCYAMLVVSTFFGILRLVKGPTTLNRIVAFDTIAVSLIGILIIYSISQNTTYFLEIILIFCLLGFVGTVTFIDFLFRKLQSEDVPDDLD